MKRIFISASFLFMISFSFSQEIKTESSSLSYHKEIPDTSSYEVVKNTTGEEPSQEILEEINLHRRHNEDFHWVVNDKIEIYIYKF